MTGRRVTVEGLVQAAPDEVWEVVTDIDRIPEVLPSVDAVERVTAAPLRVGTTWRETRTVLGRTRTHLLRITRAEAPRLLVVEAITDAVPYRAELLLAPVEAADGPTTRLSMSYVDTPLEATLAEQLVRAVTGPVGRRLARHLLEQELAHITAVAERRG